MDASPPPLTHPFFFTRIEMMLNLHLLIYRFVLVPVLSLACFLLAPFISKLRKGLKDRNWGLGRSYPELSKLDVYWFHCSSGELEYARPLIRELKKRKNVQVVVTWHSPTAKKLGEKITEIDFLIPSPWESQTSYNKFLEHFKPKALLIARTDIWANMLLAAKNNGIKSILFSATFVKGSTRYKNSFARGLYKTVHNLIDEIYCVTEDDKQNFLDLAFQNQIFVSGDTRYEQVLWRLENSPKPSCEIPRDSRSTFLIGSSWEEDEKVVLNTFSDLKLNYRFIVTPHEPHQSHIESLCAFCEKNNLSFQLYKKSEKFTADVLIIDCVGVLASLYAYADIAFIGGSYKGSIHSVMEALAAGCPALFGPHYKNNREAIEFLTHSLTDQLCITNICNDEKELKKKLEHYNSIEDKSQIKRNIIREIQSKTGTTQVILDKLI